MENMQTTYFAMRFQIQNNEIARNPTTNYDRWVSVLSATIMVCYEFELSFARCFGNARRHLATVFGLNIASHTSKIILVTSNIIMDLMLHVKNKNKQQNNATKQHSETETYAFVQCFYKSQRTTDD